MSTRIEDRVGQHSNRRLVIRLLLAVLGMFGFGYALVPLYDVFCDVAGINGKVRGATAEVAPPTAAVARDVHLDLVTTVGGDAPLTFRAEDDRLTVAVGRLHTVHFTARNLSGRRWTGQAVPSIAPGWAARYLKKIECFCFEQQVFEPNEVKVMPVRFYLDPELPERVKDMSLSYTFFETPKN